MLQKLIDKIKTYQYQVFLAVCISMIAFISFNLGKIATNEKGSIKITEGANIYKAASVEDSGGEDVLTTPRATPKPLDLRVVVSKASDSRKFHYSWCGSWKKIKPENQVWFETEAEAIKAGYTLAGNCTR